MKLYTRSGDDGTTGLFGGGRVRKDSLRIAAIGDVDELNSMLGLMRCSCENAMLAPIIDRLQHQLFDLGADLATVSGPDAVAMRRIDDEVVAWAEKTIDALVEGVEPLKKFILPGGTELAARAHLARAVCRRTERTCLALSQHEPLESAALIYLNRVSDLLFALARRANHNAGVADVTWG